MTNYDESLRFLREADRDRYLCVLLSPENARPALTALYAFNAEIARVRDVVSEPMPGEIRLQWWRDTIASAAEAGFAGPPVAALLLETIRLHDLPITVFDRYVEARIFDLYDDPMPDRAAYEAYAGETASTLIQLAARVLDSNAANSSADAAGHAGVALSVAGHLLLMGQHRARGQVYVPGDLLSATGLDRDGFLKADDRAAVHRAISAFAALGREHLAKARTALAGIDPGLMPAFLPVALAEPIFDRAERKGAAVLDGLSPQPQWKRQWRLWRALAGRRI